MKSQVPETASATRMQLLCWLCIPWGAGLHWQTNLVLLCVLCPLTHKANFPFQHLWPCVYLNPEFEVGGGMSAQEYFSSHWEGWTMLESMGFIYWGFLNAWRRNVNNYNVYECFQSGTRGENCSLGPESLQYKTRTNDTSFPCLTMSLSSLNVKAFNALLKILSLCTKPAYMKGWRSLKRKAS